MGYVAFDPKRHKGLELYEFQTEEQGSLLITKVILSKSTFEQASRAPWLYVVAGKGVNKDRDEQR